MCQGKDFCKHERQMHRVLTELERGEDVADTLDRLRAANEFAARLVQYNNAAEQPARTEVSH